MLRGVPDYGIDTVLELTRQSATDNCEWRSCPRFLRGGHRVRFEPVTFRMECTELATEPPQPPLSVQVTLFAVYFVIYPQSIFLVLAMTVSKWDLLDQKRREEEAAARLAATQEDDYQDEDIDGKLVSLVFLHLRSGCHTRNM